MKLKLYYFIPFFLCIQFNLNAQILNLDKTEEIDSTIHKQSKIALSIATDQQKKSLVDIYFVGDFTLINKNNSTTLYSKVDKVKNGLESIQDAGVFQIKNNQLLGGKLYMETFVQYQWDIALGLRERDLIGTNFVHYFQNTKTKDFFIGGGVFLEKERWLSDIANAKAITELHPKLNITSKYSFILPNNNFEFILRFFNQSGYFSNTFRNRTSLFNQFQFPISKHLSTSFNFDCIYDIAPIVPIDKFHYNYYQTLSYSFN